MPEIQRRFIHVITPGDHFSPRTGSAIPTVVHGLSHAAAVGSRASMVLVARGTYADRYESAEVAEYEPARRTLPFGRYVDPAAGRLGLPRLGSRRTWGAATRDQDMWPESIIIAHNGVQLVPTIDTTRHRAVLYAHNQLFHTYSKRESARTLDRVAAIVCVSEFLAEHTAVALPRSLIDRIRVVHNGVDCQAFYPRVDSERSSELSVLFIGRMIPLKGADILIEALRLLDRPDIKATVLGSAGFDPKAPLSAFEESLRTLAQPLGDRVNFITTAPRTTVPELLREADLIVVPSRWPEPFALTVLEGMATGVPVIGSTVGGIPEALGGVGVQVSPNDANALAQAILSFADDESYRQVVGKACRAHAESHDWAWARRVLDRHMSALD